MATDLFRSVSDFFNQVEGKFVGYDETFSLISSLSTHPQSLNYSKGYPPYNIVRNGDNIRIELAVAGFSEKDVSVDVQDSALMIKSISNSDESDTDFLYKGIASRSFERSFHLAKTVIVDDAKLVNGILTVYMHNEIPENRRARNIQINSSKKNEAEFLRD
jgi:molecular chaperone IbpA